MLYTEDNITNLVKKIKGSEVITGFPFDYWKKLKTDLQVHTQGKLFNKVVSVYDNEDPNATKFVLETYETVTQGSIWKGIDNIARIFKNTGLELQADAKSIVFINENEFTKKIINNFIDISIAKDPNAVCIPYFENDKWDFKFIETEFIESITKNDILIIDELNSEFTYKREYLNHFSNNKKIKTNNILLENVVREYTKKSYIYISESQYITFSIDKSKEINNLTYEIKNFDVSGIKPFIHTGVNKKIDFVFESPVQGFIPFGNIALLQHRTSRSVENIFGYPRMSEVEMPCEESGCSNGKVICNVTESNPNGMEDCNTCKGTGTVSLQSIFKIYKRKLSATNPDLNINIDPVRFHTPDIGILDHVSSSWQESLKLGEYAIYVPQQVETGNVQSAKSREKQLEQMYGWLDRISQQFYHSAEQILNNTCLLNGLDVVTVKKPISFAILSELESFDYLNLIVNSETPIFIKTIQVESFLKKYISNSNPIIRIVNILTKVDLFCFYSGKDLKELSNNGIIDDNLWRIHTYAYPLLERMYKLNSEILQLEDDQIITLLNAELDKFMPKKLIDNLSIDGGG